MNLESLPAEIKNYALMGREGFYAGFIKTRDLMAVNVLEGVLIPKKCLCVAIEKGAVSISYGVRFLSKPAIKGLKRFSFTGGRYPEPAEVTRALNEARVIFGARNASIILSIPRPWLIVRTAELPLAVKENLPSVVAYELDRFTPLNTSEALYDFSVVSEGNEKITLLIIAMRAQTLSPYIEELKANGLDTHRITTSITSFCTVCRVLGNGGDTTVCLDITDEGYEGCIIKDGRLRSTISEEFPDTGYDKMGFVKEGILSVLQGLEVTEVPPVVLVNAPSHYTAVQNQINVPIRQITKDDLKEKFGMEIDNDLTGSLGGVIEELWSGRQGFNLAGRGFETRKRNLLTGATLVLLGMIVLAMALNLIVPLYMQKARLDRIEQQIALRQNDVRAIEALRQETSSINVEITTIRNFKENSPMALDIMKEMTTIVPKNTWLTRFRMTGETVEIEGYAASATELLPRLEQSPLFRKVEFSSPTIRDTRLNSDRFVIKMEIEGYEKKPGPGVKK